MSFRGSTIIPEYLEQGNSVSTHSPDALEGTIAALSNSCS